MVSSLKDNIWLSRLQEIVCCMLWELILIVREMKFGIYRVKIWVEIFVPIGFLKNLYYTRK